MVEVPCSSMWFTLDHIRWLVDLLEDSQVYSLTPIYFLLSGEDPAEARRCQSSTKAVGRQRPVRNWPWFFVELLYFFDKQDFFINTKMLWTKLTNLSKWHWRQFLKIFHLRAIYLLLYISFNLYFICHPKSLTVIIFW